MGKIYCKCGKEVTGIRTCDCGQEWAIRNPGRFQFAAPVEDCKECGGNGKCGTLLDTRPCPHCRGKGKIISLWWRNPFGPPSKKKAQLMGRRYTQ
jgi:hypothetical protein